MSNTILIPRGENSGIKESSLSHHLSPIPLLAVCAKKFQI